MKKDANLEYVKKLRSGGVNNKAIDYINNLRLVKPSAPSENIPVIPEGWVLPTNQVTVGKKYAIIAVTIDGDNWSRVLKGSTNANGETYDSFSILTNTNIFNNENKSLNVAAFLEGVDDEYIFVCEEYEGGCDGYSNQFVSSSGFFGGAKNGRYLGGYDPFGINFDDDNTLSLCSYQIGNCTGLIAPKSIMSVNITIVNDDSYTHKVYIYELPE